MHAHMHMQIKSFQNKKENPFKFLNFLKVLLKADSC